MSQATSKSNEVKSEMKHPKRVLEATLILLLIVSFTFDKLNTNLVFSAYMQLKYPCIVMSLGFNKTTILINLKWLQSVSSTVLIRNIIYIYIYIYTLH